MDMVKELLERRAEIEARDSGGRTPLWFAAHEGKMDMVKELLALRADIEAKDKDERTPLSHAAGEGKMDMVKELLARRADHEAKDKDERTPLWFAAHEGNMDTVKELLVLRADIEAKDCHEKVTPLWFAADAGKMDMVKELLSFRADIEAKNVCHLARTPLSEAAQKGNMDMVKELLAFRADLEAKDKFRRTPLSHAAGAGEIDTVKELLALRADLEAKEGERTPLSEAAKNGKIDMVKDLLALRADLEGRDSRRRTPLTYAAEAGKMDTVKELLSHRADIEAKGKDWRTPLWWAAGGGKMDTVKELLAHRADIEAKVCAWTPLWFAAGKGKMDTVKELLALRADIEAKDSSQRTPLWHLAGEGNMDMVKELLALRADIEAKDKDERTPLSHAAGEGKMDMVRELLALRADLEAKDCAARTPLSHAAGEGKMDMVKELLAHRADIEAKDTDERTPLWRAAGEGKMDTVKELLALRADIEAKDRQQRTPLWHAADEGNVDMVGMLLACRAEHRTVLSHAAREGELNKVKMLLAHRADIEAKDEQQRTPLMHAAGEGNLEVVEELLAHRADIEAKDGEELTPLMHAAVARKWPVAEIVLTRRANPHATNKDGKTALVLALSSADEEAKRVVELRNNELLTLTVSKEKELMDKFTESVSPVSNPFGIWMAGGAGSGKGFVLDWLTTNGFIGSEYAHLDVDRNRCHFPLWDEKAYIGEDDTTRTEKAVVLTTPVASKFNERMMDRCTQQAKPFVYDGTFRNKLGSLKYCVEAKRERLMNVNATQGEGLKVIVIFVSTDLEEARRRVESRRREKGRPVQAEFISLSHAGALETVKMAEGHHAVDLVVRIDNTDEDKPQFQDPELANKLRALTTTSKLLQAQEKADSRVANLEAELKAEKAAHSATKAKLKRSMAQLHDMRKRVQDEIQGRTPEPEALAREHIEAGILEQLEAAFGRRIGRPAITAILRNLPDLAGVCDEELAQLVAATPVDPHGMIDIAAFVRWISEAGQDMMRPLPELVWYGGPPLKGLVASAAGLAARMRWGLQAEVGAPNVALGGAEAADAPTPGALLACLAAGAANARAATRAKLLALRLVAEGSALGSADVAVLHLFAADLTFHSACSRAWLSLSHASPSQQEIDHIADVDPATSQLSHALAALPARKVVCYRACRLPLSEMPSGTLRELLQGHRHGLDCYRPGSVVLWRHAVTATTDASLAEELALRGEPSAGCGVVFKVRRATGARCISEFSGSPEHGEVAFPPNSCFRVVGLFPCTSRALRRGAGVEAASGLWSVDVGVAVQRSDALSWDDALRSQSCVVVMDEEDQLAIHQQDAL